jgi:hypothetical protein
MMCAPICNNETETVLHVFIECRHVHVTDIWSKLDRWLVACDYLQMDLTNRDIIFGVDYTDHVVNLCLLVTQFVIYRCKLGNRLITFPAVKIYIR